MNNPHNTRNHVRNGAANEEAALPTMGQLMGVLGRITEAVAQTVDLNQAEAARRVEQPRRHDSLDNFLKKNPLKFDGTPDATIVTNWKDQLEKIFEAMACTDEEKVRFAVFTLEAEAATWWRATKARFERDEAIVTWAAFVLAFDNQYFSDTVKDKLEKEFHNLVQGEISVAAYESKFTTLIRYAEDIANNEGRKARRFVQGLKAQLQEKMAINRYESYGVAVLHATNLEINLPTTGGTIKRQREDDHDSNAKINEKRPMWYDNRDQGTQQGIQFENFVPLAIVNTPELAIHNVRNAANDILELVTLFAPDATRGTSANVSHRIKIVITAERSGIYRGFVQNPGHIMPVGIKDDMRKSYPHLFS